MELTELVGKKVIRTAPHRSLGDRSFMTDPIRIVYANGMNALYKYEDHPISDLNNEKRHVMASDFMDDNWRDYDELLSSVCGINSKETKV